MMETMVFDKSIKDFTKEWKQDICRRIQNDSYIYKLAIIQVGDNEASNRYIRNKIKDCEQVGIKAELHKFDENVETIEIVKTLVEVQREVDGVIIQLPVPPQIDMNFVKEYLWDSKDVDGFKPTSKFKPCTPLGIMKYLEYCNFDLDGKSVTICGRSEIVGKPLAQMMLDKNATVTVCHSHTKNIYQHIVNADLIVTAVGKAKFLNCYPIHVPVVDVGINFDENGKMIGDCFNTENRDVTPVPGGVGLLTRCALLENLWEAANARKETM